jgi:hypothetical protein
MAYYRISRRVQNEMSLISRSSTTDSRSHLLSHADAALSRHSALHTTAPTYYTRLVGVQRADFVPVESHALRLEVLLSQDSTSVSDFPQTRSSAWSVRPPSPVTARQSERTQWLSRPDLLGWRRAES